MNILWLLISTCLCLLSLWLGAFVLYELPEDHWAELPPFITAYLIFIGGVATALVKGI